ncbi:MAG: AtzG-like protein [bacterium]
MTLEELEHLAGLLGLSLSREQIEQLLPEVQRLREHAARLRELPLDPKEPPLRFAIP